MEQLREEQVYLFEELVEHIMAESEAAGIAVAIVDGEGRTKYQKCFGFRDKEKELPVDENTIFGLASVTKSFTALAIMQLAELGVVDLLAPVTRYVPEFQNKNQEPVLVWHLLCHSGGYYPLKRILVDEVAEKLGLDETVVGDLAYNDALAAEGVRLVAERLDAQTKEKGLIGKPGRYMSYCNDGFGLLSDIIRRYGGEPSYADYIKKYILEPLGMERSGCDFVKPLLDENATVLYKRRDGVMTGGWNFHDNAFVLNGGGAMKSTLNDLKQYVSMYLRRGRTQDGTRLLSSDGVKEMCRPRQDYKPGSWYCYGLSTKQMDDLVIVEHGGSLTGVSSNISFSYEADAGVIVLCNTSDVPVSVIADAAMKLNCKRNPVPTRDTYTGQPWSKKTMEAACGTYVSGEGSTVELYLKDESHMGMKVNGQEQSIVPVQPQAAIVRSKIKDGYVELHVDDDGNVFAIGFGGRMIPRS